MPTTLTPEQAAARNKRAIVTNTILPRPPAVRHRTWRFALPEGDPVSDHEAETRPEPVLTKAAYAKWTVAILTLAFGAAEQLGINLGGITLTTAEEDVALAAPVVVAAVNWAIIHVTGLAIRAHVTPTASPTSATGEQLVSLSTARAMASTAAVAASNQVPTPTPWAEDSTLTGAPA